MDVLGVGVLIGALLIATTAGFVLRARAGRVRPAAPIGSVGSVGSVRSVILGAPGGGWAMAGRAPSAQERVLLLQLSSPACAPCRQTAVVLAELSGRTTGVVHAEIDVADRLDVARALHVLRTPTVVAFDRSGVELLRVSGVPRVADLEAALATTLTAGRPTGDARRASRLRSTP